MKGFWIRKIMRELASSEEIRELRQAMEELTAMDEVQDAGPPQGENNEIWRAVQLQRREQIRKQAHMMAAKAEASQSMFTELNTLVFEGNVDAVRGHLDGGEPMPHDSLALACCTGHAPVVQLLLERGASVNSTAMQIPAANFAAMSGHVAVLALLLDHHADCTVASAADGTSALVQAARAGHIAALELLLRRCPVSEALPHQRDLALLCACEQGKLDCASMLLTSGANASARIAEQMDTPILVLACQNGQLECAALLLEHDADLDAACIGGTSLVVACQQGHTNLVHMLLAKGAAVDRTRTDGLNGLIVASATGHLECLQLCSAYGALRTSPRVAQGEPGGYWEAIAVAEHHSHPHVSSWLQKTAGWSPLHHLEQMDCQRAESLLRSGACVHVPANAGDADKGVYVTPFMRALEVSAPSSARTRRAAPAATYETAQVLIDAGKPWSCATHRLAPAPKRKLARDLLRLGYQIARCVLDEHARQAFLDAWRGALMPVALSSVLCEGVLVHLSLATDSDRDHRALDGCIGVIEAGDIGGVGERLVSVIGRADGVHLDRRSSRGGPVAGGNWGAQPTGWRSHLGVAIRVEFMRPVEVATDGTIQLTRPAPPDPSGNGANTGKGTGKAAAASEAAEDQPPSGAASVWPGERARDGLVGKHVRLHGLSGRPDLNGSHGVVLSWEEARGRYAVALRQGEQRLCVRPQNLELVRRGSGGAAATPSQHLRQRQAERGIMDVDLDEAVRVGERVELPDDTVTYRHKGIVYVTKDGVGLTAYRIEPEQCICKLTPAQVAAATADFESGPNRRNGNPVHAAIGELQIGMFKAQFACRDCLGCQQHRTPTDPVAMFLEHVDFSLPKYRGLFGEGYTRGLLLLMAAGSLLVPVRCATCHGIHKLRRNPNPMDEGSTCTWIRHLLNLNPRANTMPLIDFREIQLAGGCTPLSAAAKAGHFRCCVDLLRFGASRQEALMDLNGPLAGGHVICFLNHLARSERLEGIRQHLCAAYYPEILGMLSHPFEQPDHSSFNHCAYPLKMLAAVMERDESGPRRADNLEAAEVTCRIASYDDDPPETRLRPGGKFAFIWDGMYWRQLLKGPCQGPPACKIGERCIDEATYAQSSGVCYYRAEENGQPQMGMGNDPMHDEFVKSYIRSGCREAGCTLGECKVLGRHSRLPAKAL